MVDLIGEKFHYWTIIYQSENRSKDGSIKWVCKCKCGTIKEVNGQDLKRNKTKSCGCLQKEIAKKKSFKHGLINHLLYKIWVNMRYRCKNINAGNYKCYGGRGIKVCEEWNDFKVFYNFAIDNGWKPELQIDRINNNKGYEPSNCRFVTRSENQKNKRIYNKLGAKYIQKIKNRYYVTKKINNKTEYFGCFKTLEEAKKITEKL